MMIEPLLFLKSTLEHLVDEPDLLEVTPHYGGGKSVCYEIRSQGQDDKKWIIGKNGKTLDALRTITSAMGAKDGFITSVILVD